MPPAAPDSGAAPAAGSYPVKQHYPGVVNFTRAAATVACGGATEAATLEALKRDGFRTIVNLRLATESGADLDGHQAEATRLALGHVHIPFNSQNPDSQAMDRFLDVMADASRLPVYVHCLSANRVGAMWLAKRVLQDGCAVELAVAEARTIGLRSPDLEAFALRYVADRRG
jgi:protein tyrosine phosphatase (PTP) superfamily phosphohydrolase (DUF442 family)